MKGKTKAIITVFVVILAGIYYYAAIPAINIHSSETWFFIMIFLVILAVLYLGRRISWSDSVSRSCISVGNTVFFSGY